jgi:hypothetical protein
LIFFKATNITTSGGAFSDYVDEPTYRCGAGAVAGTMTDKPDGFGNLKGCILFNLYPYGVKSYMIQIVIQSINIWIRERTNMTGATATWSTWKKVC